MDAVKSLAKSVSNAFAGRTAQEATDAAGDGNEAEGTTHGALKSVKSRTVGSRAKADFATNSGMIFRAVSSDEESDYASESEGGDGGGAKRSMRLETCASFLSTLGTLLPMRTRRMVVVTMVIAGRGWPVSGAC